MAFLHSRNRYQPGPLEIHRIFDPGAAPDGLDEYVGWANPRESEDGNWIIEKSIFTGDHLDEIKIGYGSWTKRASLTYG